MKAKTWAHIIRVLGLLAIVWSLWLARQDWYLLGFGHHQSFGRELWLHIAPWLPMMLTVFSIHLADLIEGRPFVSVFDFKRKKQ